MKCARIGLAFDCRILLDLKEGVAGRLDVLDPAGRRLNAVWKNTYRFTWDTQLGYSHACSRDRSFTRVRNIPGVFLVRIDRARASGAIPIEVANGGWIYASSFRVDSYSNATLEGLKRKLQQFPAGTLFRWCPQAADPAYGFSQGQRQEMLQDLTAFLSEHSMSIKPCSK